jgi:hypothetical protein
MQQLGQWLEESPLADFIFLAICVLAVGFVSEVALLSRIRKLNRKLGRFQKDLADARMMAGLRLKERIISRTALKEEAKPLVIENQDETNAR